MGLKNISITQAGLAAHFLVCIFTHDKETLREESEDDEENVR